MPQITEQELENFKKAIEELEEEKSKVSALTTEKEELTTKLNDKTKLYDDLVLENTRLRNLNGKLLLQKETDVVEEPKVQKTIEDEVLEILKGDNK